MPRGFSYHMTLNLALNAGCDGWQVWGSHMTDPHFHSHVYHPPGHHAGSKSTQYCSEECSAHSIWYPTQTDERSCVQETGVCQCRDMIQYLVQGLIQKSMIQLSIFYMYVLCFIVQSAKEWDDYTLRVTICAIGLLDCSKSHCLICGITYTKRS